MVLCFFDPTAFTCLPTQANLCRNLKEKSLGTWSRSLYISLYCGQSSNSRRSISAKMKSYCFGQFARNSFRLSFRAFNFPRYAMERSGTVRDWNQWRTQETGGRKFLWSLPFLCSRDRTPHPYPTLLPTAWTRNGQRKPIRRGGMENLSNI